MSFPIASDGAGPLRNAARVKAIGHDLGFDLVGIAPAEASCYGAEFGQWLGEGRHAGMAYMAQCADQRTDIRRWLPGARSVIVAAVNYWHPTPAAGPDVAVFAQYAAGADYHRWMRRRLVRLGRALTVLAGEPVAWRPFADTSPILEREQAMRAGLGWIGKNAMLINHRIGSYLLLGGLATTMLLAADPPQSFHCGTCTRCMDACPTRAIIAPHVVDSRRCIAYHTIESRDPIPDAVARAMGNRVFGCDICQEVCPMNRRPDTRKGGNLTITRHQALHPRPATVGRRLSDLVTLSDQEFASQFSGSAVRRAGAAGLRRSARASLGSRRAAGSH